MVTEEPVKKLDAGCAHWDRLGGTLCFLPFVWVHVGGISLSKARSIGASSTLFHFQATSL